MTKDSWASSGDLESASFAAAPPTGVLSACLAGSTGREFFAGSADCDGDGLGCWELAAAVSRHEKRRTRQRSRISWLGTLAIIPCRSQCAGHARIAASAERKLAKLGRAEVPERPTLDRKSTRLNSSHLGISYAVFCLKKE